MRLLRKVATAYRTHYVPTLPGIQAGREAGQGRPQDHHRLTFPNGSIHPQDSHCLDRFCDLLSGPGRVSTNTKWSSSTIFPPHLLQVSLPMNGIGWFMR